MLSLFFISASNHATIVDKGMSYYDVMSSQFGCFPKIEHHVCIMGGLLNQRDLSKTWPCQ